MILASSVAKFPTGEKSFEFCCHRWGKQLSQLERYLNQCEVYVHLWYRIDSAFFNISRPPIIRVSDKVMIPQDDHPDINFVGLLIGPRGNTLKCKFPFLILHLQKFDGRDGVENFLQVV